jgi:predicted permease
MFIRLRSFLRATFRRDRFEDDMSAEMRFHIDAYADDLVRAGMTRDDARRRARLEFGGMEGVKEEARQSRGLRAIDEIGQDLRYAWRLLQRGPMFAATAIVSLAIGIGANTTVFTVANGLLFHPPEGVADPGRLVDIGVSRDGVGFNPSSYPNYLDIRDRATTLSGVYATQLFGGDLGLRVAGTAEQVESVSGLFVTTNYFSVLGVRPAAGRLFGSADGEFPGGTPLVVLSHRFWVRRFNQDPAVVGATFHLNGHPFTVIGVAAAGFQGAGILLKDVWLPINMIGATSSRPPSIPSGRGGAWLVIGGRLKPGVSIAQASSEVDALGQALEREFPEENRRKGLRLIKATPLGAARGPVAALLLFLTGIVGLVLLVACANIAGVLLSRAAARQREIAVRMSMGAGRARLARQLLTETALLCAIGGVAGLVLARVSTSLLWSLLPALPFPVAVALPLDVRVIVFATGVSLAAALLCGVMPAVQSSKADLVAALKDEAGASSGRARLRNAFITGQVAISVLLVAIGSLFLHALHRAGTDPGFDARDVYLAPVDLSTVANDDTGPLFVSELMDTVRQVPGVESATLARVFPRGFEGIGVGGLSRPGVAPAGESPEWDWNIVEPGYFATLRIPLVAGRDFDASDRTGAQPVVIVGETAARYYWPGENPIGKFILHANGPTTRPLLVVGVARDVKSSSLVDGISTSFVYLPLQQNYATSYMTSVAIAVRTSRGQRVIGDIRRLVTSRNPGLVAGTVQTLESYAALGLAPQRVLASVAGGLGLVGLLLASLGIYGVTAYAVTRRRRELGIRVALGATRGAIHFLVLKQGMFLIGIGSLLGLALAAAASTAASPILASFLFGVAPLDPVTFLGVPLLFAAVGLSACYGPARRATDGSDVLKH